MREGSLEPRLIGVLPADESRGDVNGKTSFGLAEDNRSRQPARVQIRARQLVDGSTRRWSAVKLAAALTDAADEIEQLS